jgi:hypothetical protein
VSVLSPAIKGPGFCDCKETCQSAKDLSNWALKFVDLDEALSRILTANYRFSEFIDITFPRKYDQAIGAELKINDLIVEAKGCKILKNFVVKGSSDVNFSIS